jgi:ankyrin repeat protein
MADADAVHAFVEAATHDGRRKGEQLLAEHPEVADDPWAGLVLGRGWDGDASEPGGPLGWAPLLYVCHSFSPSVELARDLLAHGADPNACAPQDYGPMSALYGAAGVSHDATLTALLLDAGASPDDGESLYHATESPDPACVRLLLEAGATVDGSNALGHALDGERHEHLELLLDACAAQGTDPNTQGPLISFAVRRDRCPDCLRILVARGLDLDRPAGEPWRHDPPVRTGYRHAVIRNRARLAETLAELGASTETTLEDAAIAAVARGERPATPLDLDDLDAREALIRNALFGDPRLTLELAGPNLLGPVDASPFGTLLHHAAWVGDAGLVETLLAAGADVAIPSPAGLSTPLGWAALASSHDQPPPERDHLRVGQVLVAAGDPVDARIVETADGPLRAWLEAQCV